MRVLRSKSAAAAVISETINLRFGLIHGAGNAYWPAGASCLPEPRYQDARAGSLQAKIQYCSDCHGPSAKGYRGYFPMLSVLAGQTTESTSRINYWSSIERRREPHMAMVMSKVHGVSPALQVVLAAHFPNALNSPPFGPTAKQLAGEGKDIYEQGMPMA